MNETMSTDCATGKAKDVETCGSLGTAVLEALGINLPNVVHASIDMDAGNVVMVNVRHFVPLGALGEVVERLKAYRVTQIASE